MSLLFSLGAFASSGVSSKPGMVLLKPTSIAHSGTSASIGANGQVTFTAVTSLSLNGVFSATYDNYMVSIRSVASTGSPGIFARLRVAGTDATGSNYTYQWLYANSTTVSGGRTTDTNGLVAGDTSATQRSGSNLMIYGPFLAQPTASRVTNAWGESSAYMSDYATTHSLSTSYDGITLRLATAGNITGAVQVYGVKG